MACIFELWIRTSTGRGHPRFFFVLSQIDHLRGTQRKRRLQYGWPRISTAGVNRIDPRVSALSAVKILFVLAEFQVGSFLQRGAIRGLIQ
jgi:hypothetical protein